MNLYPSILTDSVKTVQEQLDLLTSFSDLIHTVQIDIVDGEYADNLTITPIDLLDVDFHDFHIDFHLMVNEPDDFLFECLQLENVRSVITQIERLSDQQGFIEELKKKDIQAGFSLNLYTPFDSISRTSLGEIAIVQVMGIEAGFQNKKFEGEKVLNKVADITQQLSKFAQIELIVDGGVEKDNFRSILKSGADSIAVGSELWQSTNLNETIEHFFKTSQIG